MERLYQAKDEIEAQLLRDYLGASHIAATVLGRYQAAAAGGLPTLEFPWVWVVEVGDLPRARTLLEEFLARRAHPAGAPPWQCECGEWIGPEFDLCWQCGRSRPA